MNGLQFNKKSNIGTTKKRGALIYTIGIIAFISAAVSLVFATQEFLVLLKDAGMNIRALEYTSLASIAIELIFSALEIVTGLSLIKQWKRGESIEIHKTVAKLVQVIVYEGFITALTDEIMTYIMSDGQIAVGISMVYIAVYIVYYIIMSSMSTLVKRNEIMKLYYLMMISSFIAIGFSVGEFHTAMIGFEFTEIGFGLANILLTSLIFAFAVSTVVYYSKNPEVLMHDIEASEDADLIRQTDKHRYLKVYSNRATETGINTVINLIYFLAIALGCVGIVFFVIEQDVARFAGGTLTEIIDNIRAEFKRASVESITNLMLIFYILLVYPLSYISAATGIIKRDSRSKISLATLSTVGIGIMIFSNIFVIIEFIMDFSKYRSFDLESMQFSRLALLVLFAVYSIAQKFRKNKTKYLYEGVSQGDSYRSHFKEIRRKILFDGIFSIFSLALMLVACIENETMLFSHPFFAASVILIMLATQLEVKHPFAEYAIVKRKIFAGGNAQSVEITEE